MRRYYMVNREESLGPDPQTGSPFSHWEIHELPTAYGGTVKRVMRVYKSGLLKASSIGTQSLLLRVQLGTFIAVDP